MCLFPHVFTCLNCTRVYLYICEFLDCIFQTICCFFVFLFNCYPASQCTFSTTFHPMSPSIVAVINFAISNKPLKSWVHVLFLFMFSEFIISCMYQSVEVLITQSCSTLCNTMDYSLPGSEVHGILQARILEWIAISSSRELSQPWDQIQVSCIAGRFFTLWATREAHNSVCHSGMSNSLQPHGL